jgi:hypothetical protein
MAMRQSSWSSMAADVADINRDGHDDFFIVEMLSQHHVKRQTQRANYETGIQEPSMAMGLDRPQTQRNTLFLNRGDGTYAEIARMAGLDATEWSWGTVFMDVDLDGWDDVLVANGNNHDLLDGDATIAAVMAMRSGFQRSGPKTLLMYPSLHTSNLVFRNKGNLTLKMSVSHGDLVRLAFLKEFALLIWTVMVIWIVILNNLQSTPSVYRNNATVTGYACDCVGLGQIPSAIGARLRLVTGDSGNPSIQTRMVISGGRYLSSDETIHCICGPRRKRGYAIGD